MAESAKIIVAVAILYFVGVIAEEMMLNVYVKKPMAVVSDKFLSITLDPVVLFNSDSLSIDMDRSASMAKALSPAYVRIAGPRSNSYVFERGLYSEETNADTGYTITEKHWIQLHQWAERSGLDVITTLAPQPQQSDASGTSSKWDPRNALDLISFSDHMGYNGSWQLGYECQTHCNDMSGADLGRYVQRLRNMLDAFPRYAESGLLIGPDVESWKTRQQQLYLQDFFNFASASLSAVTWHPDFASVSLENEEVSMHQDDIALDKDSLFRALGRFIFKKPLWLAESKPEECKRQFLGALVWARRLGNAAKLGAQVIMRQPDNSNLFRPSPDYWVSVLHKMLVGREVLDTRIFAGNRTHVHFYGHCTRPSSKYEAGSLTIFGINLTPTKVTVSPKGLKAKLVHKYILLPGYDTTNRMFAETVLLNNEILNLANGKDVPDLQPVISTSDKGVKLKLPAGGIGFWVLPGLKIRSCMSNDDENPEKNMLKKSTPKRIEDFDLEVENEPEYPESEETKVTGDSVEDKKSSDIKKRQLLRRTSRHSRDEHRDATERKHQPHGRAETTRHELDKMLRRKEHHPVEVKSPEKPSSKSRYDETDDSSEESSTRTDRKRPKVSLASSLPKVQNKKRQADEIRRKQLEERAKLKKSRAKSEKEDPEDKSMDTGKVIEALTLITKVENSMGKEASNVTSGSADTRDEHLLDEVLNTEKSKRTSIPTKIEDQLKALYNLLSEKKEKRTSPSSLTHRQRRDIDRRQNEGIFIRRRPRGDDERRLMKERRLQELKQRLREKHPLRREKQREPESDEDDFYGFPPYEPLANFPRGDVYYPHSSDPRESDDEFKRLPKLKGDIHATVARDDGWSKENLDDYIPREFYENVKLPLPPTPNVSDFAQAETVKDSKPAEVTTDSPKQDAKSGLPQYDGVKAEEKQVEQSRIYYQNNPSSNQGYNYQEVKPTPQPEYQPAYQVPGKRIDVTNYQPTSSYQATQTNYQQNPSTYHYAYQNPSNYPTLYPRAKRHLNNIEDILHREMIAQDDNNLRDCQCRVIRNAQQDCPDCQRSAAMNQMPYGIEWIEQYPQMPSNQNPYAFYEDTSLRERRNLKEPQVVTAPRAQIQTVTVNDQESQKTMTQKDESRIKSQEKQEFPKAQTKEPQWRLPGKQEQTTSSKALIETVKKSQNKEGAKQSASSKSQIEETKTRPQVIKEVQTTPAQKEETKVEPEEKQEPQKLDITRTLNEETKVKSQRETQQMGSLNVSNEETMASKKSKREQPDELVNNDENLENTTEARTEETPETDEPASSNVETISNEDDMLNLESQSDRLTASRLPRKIMDPMTKFFLYKKDDGLIQAAKREVKVSGPAKRKPQKSPVQDSSNHDNSTEAHPTVEAAAQAKRKAQKSPAQESTTLNSSGTNVEARPVTRPASERENHSGLSAKSRKDDSDSSARPSSPKSESIAEKDTSDSGDDSEDIKTSKVDSQPSDDPKNIFNTKASVYSVVAKNAKPKTHGDQKNNPITKTVANSKSKSEKNPYPTAITEPNNPAKPKSRIGSEPKNLDSFKTSNDSEAKVEKKSKNEKSELRKAEPKTTTERAEKTTEKTTIKIEPSTTPEPDLEITENVKKGSESKRVTTSTPKAKTPKPEDQAKVRQARLTTRAEALAALKKENETKRAKKMIETRMKLLENEDASIVEYEKRYRDQLERLKMRLRAKREKMLHQYRDELLEVVNEDSKESRQHRRDLLNDSKKFLESVKKVPRSTMPKILPKENFGKVLKKHNRRSVTDPESPKHDSKRSLSPEEQFEEETHGKQVNQTPEASDDFIDDPVVTRKYRQAPEDLAQNNDNYYYQSDYVYYAQPNEQNSNQGQQNDQIQQQGSDKYQSEANSNYYKENQDDDYEVIQEDELDDKIEEVSAERSFPKSKRSGLSMIEMDPPIYEEYEPNYEMQEFYHRPSYYQRSYRHYPYGHSSGRYRRQSSSSRGENLDGPLSFSLSLEKSKMKKKSGVVDVTDESARKKRSAMYETSTGFATKSGVNKNIKKVSKSYSLTNKKVKKFNKNPNRPKRSLDEPLISKFMTNNEIDQDDSDLDEVLNNIVEMKQDEKLLQEFDHQKSKLIENYRKNQQSLNKFMLATNEILTTTETTKSMEMNIETIITDTMPKIETVITGGIKKAENFTENLEDFIENFDDDEEEDDDTTELPKGKENSSGITNADDGRLSHRIFLTVVGRVKKIFDIVSSFAHMFQNS